MQKAHRKHLPPTPREVAQISIKAKKTAPQEKSCGAVFYFGRFRPAYHATVRLIRETLERSLRLSTCR